MHETTTISRRQFVGAVGASTALFTIVPRHVLGGPAYMAPSDMLNIAGIGVGGMGERNLMSIKTPDAMLEQWKKEEAEAEQTAADLTPEQQERRERRRRWRQPKELANVYAICDVDLDYAKKTIEHYPKAKVYQDFRKMLDELKEIDAVVIATPDHTHAVIAMHAMKMGKHVFCQKPLTRTIYEARVLAKTAKETGVVTQMGNQGHATEGARLIKEWLMAGAIGDVREVAVWTNRPIWPQGDIPRPAEEVAIPETLDWDLWLGPAPKKSYHPDVCHFNWRGWRDYGTGALGDMGAHLIDHPFWALDLGQPVTVQASSTAYSDDAYPLATVVTYEFAARGSMLPVTLTWSDGGITPPRPSVMEAGRRLGTGGSGVLYYGDKGILMHGDYGNGPRLIPESAMEAYEKPEPTIPRSPGIHEEWIEAIKNGGQSSTDFSYSGPLTETMLLGNVAVFMKDKNTTLAWDAENMRITNVEQANNLLHYEYREGWTL
ncbi:gfo/Idh/MocA family oxidoreductase [candidate division KSB1 bacterium]|nr:Gfo/Idh/MocA family oxidoreductase [candidate division KSB1 bacterium]RQW05619.1 MAG: gfo/Idh/MocA family oxidoreductase [candidate division KSB1 bacterium]